MTLTGDKKKTIPADFTAFIPPFKGSPTIVLMFSDASK